MAGLEFMCKEKYEREKKNWCCLTTCFQVHLIVIMGGRPQNMVVVRRTMN
jgi:hypothetical protein